MTEYLYNKGLLYDSISAPDLTGDYDNMTDAEFDKIVDSLPLTLTLYNGAPLAPTVEEADLIPNARDVFVIRHPRYTRPNLHRHTYFEINFYLFLIQNKALHRINRSSGQNHISSI